MAKDLADVVIADAAPSDMRAVSQMLRLSWHETYDGVFGFDKVNAISDAWHNPTNLAANLAAPASAFLVGRDSLGRVVATSYARMTDAPSRPGGPRTPHAMLHRLYVLRALQGTGLAQDLLRETEARMPANVPWVLEVEPDNNRAIRFYEHRGFTLSQELRACGRKGSGLDALLMRRPAGMRA